MDEATYKRWWPLHLPVAKGENLSDDERTAYEAALKELHDSELLELDAVLRRNAAKTKSPAAVRAEVREAVARAAAREK